MEKVFFNNKRNGLFIYEENLSLSDVQTFPIEFKIKSPYPNPFNPIINIQYITPYNSAISIEVVDIRGRLVSQLIDESHLPGIYKMQWNAGECSSGIYYLHYTLKGDGIPPGFNIF